MARMKFLCDAERCIECNACVTACKNEHEVPWGINRRRVVTVNDGQVGAEKSMSVACMHCSDAPCMAVCPVDCFYKTEDGVVLHDKDLCIGCGYCFYACPFGAPQYPQASAFGVRGKMDKCTFCAGGPEDNSSAAEVEKYGRNRVAEGKLPLCAEMCSTKALLAGDGDMVADIYRERIKMFHVKDAELNPTGRQGVYGGYQGWVDRAGRFRSLGDGQVDFKGIFSKFTRYGYEGWAVLEWECCLKHPEDGAAEGAPFIAEHMIRKTEKAFDDFADTGIDVDGNKKALGI